MNKYLVVVPLPQVLDLLQCASDNPTVDFLFSGTGKSQREVNLANGPGGECRLIVWSKKSCVFNAVLETGLKC